MKIVAHPIIPQRGTYGYLLWLRRTLPNAYVAALKTVPGVVQFEAALTRRGLGDDMLDVSSIDFSDAVSSTPAFDPSGADQLAAAFDTGTVLDSGVTSAVNAQPTFDTSTILSGTSAPTLPPIQAPLDTIPSAASTAASAVNAAQVAQTVAAVTTVAKVASTAAMQAQAAAAGRPPIQTGTIYGSAGPYLAPIQAQPGSISSVLSSTLFGLPIWIFGVGALGLIALVSAKE